MSAFEQRRRRREDAGGGAACRLADWQARTSDQPRIDVAALAQRMAEAFVTALFPAFPLPR